MTINLFYLLTHPLTALTMLFAARWMYLGRVISVAVALLYAFAPYHIWRGEHHIALSAYFMLPVALVVALSIDDVLGPAASKEAGWSVMALRTAEQTVHSRSRLHAPDDGCGVYYALFYGVTLMLIAARRAIARRSWTSFTAPIILGVVLAAGIIAVNAPTLMYHAQNGKNPGGTLRGIGDSEVYSLRPIQLLLPVLNHRIEKLAHVTAKISASSRRSTPPSTTSPGSPHSAQSHRWASDPFYMDCPRPARPTQRGGDYHLDDLASINIVMLLLGTVGGLGFIIAAAVTPAFRGYNRVSIVIAMVALLAVGALIDRAFRSTRSQLGSP